MSSQPPPTSLRHERLALGEGVDAGGHARPQEGEEVATLLRSNEEILRQYPPPQVAAEVARRFRQVEGDKALQKRRWIRPWMVVGLPATAALLLTIWMPGQPAPPDEGPAPEITRVKGLEPGLHIHRKQARGAERLASGAPTRAGDLLMLSYVAADQPYGMVLSLDGRGAITVHLPVDGGDATPLAQQGETALPNSYELDNAPGFERFFLITGARPFTQTEVIEAVQKLAAQPDHGENGALNLPADLHATSLRLTKVTP